MPLYEYHCESCEHEFEILRPLNADPADLECPQCGSGDLAKQFSTFAAKMSGGATASTAPAGGCCRGTFT